MRTNIWRYFDFWLFGAVAVLIIFGVAMIQSTVAGNIELLELDVVGRQILSAEAPKAMAEQIQAEIAAAL